MKRIITLCMVMLISLPFLLAQDNAFRWAISAGGENAEFGEGIATDPNGNVFITGLFRGEIELLGQTIEPESIRNNMLLAKISPDKELLWYVTAEADGTMGATGFKVTYHDGHVYLLGDFHGDATFFSVDFSETELSSANRTNYIARYTENGVLDWITPVLGDQNMITTGSANNLVVDADGAVYFTTQFRGSVSIGDVEIDPQTGGTRFYAMLMKLDALGAYQWHWNSINDGDDRGEALSIAPNGNVVFAVRYAEALTVNDVLTENEGGGIAIIEVEADGTYVRDHHIATETTNRAFMFGVDHDTDGNLYLAGHARTPMHWDDDLVLEPLNEARTHGYLIKLNSSWEVSWHNLFGNIDQIDNIRAMEVSPSGHIYVAGDFQEAIDFGEGVLIESNDESRDAFFAMFDANGVIQDAVAFGGTGTEHVWGMATTPQNDVYIMGRFGGTFEAFGEEFPTAGSFDIFTVRFGNEVFDVTFQADLTVAIETGLLEDFDHETHGIMITGNLLGWPEPGAEQLMDKISDDPLMYAKTFQLEAGEYQYKYFSDFIGAGWDGGEWVGDPNRTVSVTEEMTITDMFGFLTDEVTSSALADIFVDGDPIAGFNPGLQTYYVAVEGTTDIPDVTAEAASSLATVEITQATDLAGTEAERTAIIEVVSYDGLSSHAYHVIFHQPTVAMEHEYGWTAHLSGEMANFGEGITHDEDGNVFVTGIFRGPITFLGETIEPESIRNNMFLAKVSPDMDLIWYVTAEADGTQGATGYKPYYKDGHVYLLGDFLGDATFFSADFSETSMSSDSRANYVAKYTANGMLEWITQIEAAQNIITMGSANDIFVDDAGSVYYTTQFRGSINIGGTEVNPGTGGTNFYAILVKLDNLGAYQWHWNSTHEGDDRGQAIAETPDGNILFGVRYNEALTVNGVTTENDGGGLALIEVAPDGSYVNDTHIAASSTLFLFTHTMAFDNDGNLYLGGQTRTNMAFPNGTVIEPLGTARTSAYLIKLDEEHNVLWARVFGDPAQNATLRAIQFNNQGDVYVAGDFGGQFSLAPDILMEGNGGSQDGYFAGFSTYGEVLFAHTFGGTNREDIWGMAVTSNDDVFMVGRFMGVLEAFGESFESGGSFDVFLIKFGEYVELFEVTFNVNLDPAIEFENLKDFDPEVHKIFITGSLVGWQEPGDDPDNQLMIKTSDDPMTYSKTFKLEAGEYAYKYFSDLIGAGWSGGEWPGGDDRFVTVVADTIVEDMFAYRDQEVSAPETEEVVLNLYPNPARNIFAIESDQEITEIRIVDMLGQVVYSRRNAGTYHEVNTHEMKNGIYFVQISTSAGVQTKRLQVTR